MEITGTTQGGKTTESETFAPYGPDAPAHAVDLANWLNQLPRSTALEYLGALPLERCADTFGYLPLHVQAEIARSMPRDELAQIITEMDADDRVDLFKCLGDERRLMGSVRLQALILADDETLVENIMDSTPIFVPVNAKREEAAQMVDAESRMVGIVTHDDAADAMQAEATEDFHKISTVLPFTQSLREVGVGVLYSRRVIWLSLLIFGNLFFGAGIAYFEETILAYVSLVFFLPLLIDSSGNAGSQSATLMVRALATGDVQLKH